MRKSTLKLANTQILWQINILPTAPFLVIPEVGTARRDYAPIGWLEPPAIPSNLLRVLTNATLVDFALLTSTMHMTWMRHIGGRLASSYRYSIGVVYNTFPLPPVVAKLSSLEQPAQAVLDARADYSGSTLADLYDPDLMPINLRRAHQLLDRAVDRLYRRNGFNSERERIEHLFVLYEKFQSPLTVSKTARNRRQLRGQP